MLPNNSQPSDSGAIIAVAAPGPGEAKMGGMRIAFKVSC